MTNQVDGILKKKATELIITHRLICDVCLKDLCYYKPKNSERRFMDELESIICKKCMKLRGKHN